MEVGLSRKYVITVAGKKPLNVPEKLVVDINGMPFLNMQATHSGLVRLLGGKTGSSLSQMEGYKSLQDSRNKQQSESMTSGSSGAVSLFSDEVAAPKSKDLPKPKRLAAAEIRKKREELVVMDMSVGGGVVKVARNAHPTDCLIVAMDEENLKRVFNTIAGSQNVPARGYNKDGDTWSMGKGRLASCRWSPKSRKKRYSYVKAGEDSDGDNDDGSREDDGSGADGDEDAGSQDACEHDVVGKESAEAD